MVNQPKNIVLQNRLTPNTWERYEVYPSFVLGFHGCDRSVGEAVLYGEIAHLEPSRNDYDWLGEGIYFWESSPARGLDFARERTQGGRNSRGAISDPFVVGAILDLKHCFSTTQMESLNRLQDVYAKSKDKTIKFPPAQAMPDDDAQGTLEIKVEKIADIY